MITDTQAFPRLKLAVSSCLLGENVRYDGGHKRHAFVTGALAGCADFISVCPEAAIGMGVPRPPIHLVGRVSAPRALGVDDPSIDVTDPLKAYAARQALALDDIDACIFKQGSPSCGLGKVKLFARPNAAMQRKATGLYASAFLRAKPLLPVAEEDVFDDPRRRDNFMTRVYVYRRWRHLQADGLTASGLLDFHAAHKYLVMAHSQAACQRLGRMLGDLSRVPLETLGQRYFAELMQALQRTSQRRQHVNTLQHIAGYLKRRMDAHEKASLQRLLARFDAGHCSLFSVMCALRQAFEHYPDPYVSRQVYLNPYPDSLRS